MKYSIGRAAAAFLTASALLVGSTAGAVAATPAVPVVVAPTALSAETAGVASIQTIHNKVVRVGGTRTVKPVVTTSGAVKVSAKTLTVKQGSRTLAKNKSSVKLKAGSYSVTTTVRYRTYTEADGKKVYSVEKTATKTQKLKIVSAVDFKTIAGKTAPYGGKATIKPNVSLASGVKKISTTLTVKQGSKTVATNKTSVKLKAGSYSVTTKASYRILTASGWTKTYTSTKTQKLTIKAGKRPSSTAPNADFSCPSWAPIKGNASSGIYHVPSGAFYDRTNPEECFVSESAAIKAGYRKSKR